MTRADKIHWKIVLVYVGLLSLSLVVLLARSPEPYFRIAGLVLGLGLFYVTLPLAVFLLGQMALKRISLTCGIGAVVLLAVVSLIYFVVFTGWG